MNTLIKKIADLGPNALLFVSMAGAGTALLFTHVFNGVHQELNHMGITDEMISNHFAPLQTLAKEISAQIPLATQQLD